MKNVLPITLIILLSFLTLTDTFAQRKRTGYKFTKKKKYWAIGGNLSASFYYGDIGSVSSAAEGVSDFRERFSSGSKFSPNFTFYAMKRLSPYFSAKGSLSFIYLQGTDEGKGSNQTRMYSFDTFVTELTAMAVFDIIPNGGVYYRRPFVVPYLTAGFGGLLFVPDAESNGDPAVYPGIPSDNTKVKGTWVVPAGGGIKFKVSSHMDIGIEALIHFTGTDLLDATDASNNGQVSVSPVSDIDNLDREFTRNDHFITVGATIHYVFSGGVKTPKFR